MIRFEQFASYTTRGPRTRPIGSFSPLLVAPSLRKTPMLLNPESAVTTAPTFSPNLAEVQGKTKITAPRACTHPFLSFVRITVDGNEKREVRKPKHLLRVWRLWIHATTQIPRTPSSFGSAQVQLRVATRDEMRLVINIVGHQIISCCNGRFDIIASYLARLCAKSLHNECCSRG